MLSILVVDDEPRQRKILSNMVREFRENYEVYEAKNGEEAIALCSEKKIDIIFADIRMPKMDGLSMLERISKINELMKVVVISGYDDFMYAQKAMEYKVYSYILKPIEKKKICEIILQIEEEINKERKRINEKNFMVKQLNRLRPFYFEYLMNKWIRGECNRQEIEEVGKIFRSRSRGCVILTHILQLDSGDNNSQYTDEEMNEIKINIKMWITEIMNQYGYSISFFLLHDPDIMTSVVKFSTDNDNLAVMLEKLDMLIKNLNKDYGITITIAVGQVHNDIFKSIQFGFLSAEQALNCMFYIGVGRIICYTDIQHCYTKEVKGCFTYEDELKQFIHGQVPFNKRWIDNGLKNLLGNNFVEPKILKDYICTLVLRLLHSIQNIIPEEKFSELHLQIRKELHDVQLLSISKLKLCWIDLMVKLADVVRQQKENKNNIVMERCLHYIHCHFNEELSLEELANKFHYNASYFSTLFKDYVGMPFTDYITDLRLKYAHKLLLDSNDKVYVIAQEVGYKDVKYFNKIFKKRYGLTPSECRVFSKGGKSRS